MEIERDGSEREVERERESRGKIEKGVEREVMSEWERRDIVIEVGEKVSHSGGRGHDK